MRPAPPYTQNIPIGETPLEAAARSRPQTSTAAPVGGTGWTGRGQGGAGTPGPRRGGVCPEATAADSSVPEA